MDDIRIEGEEDLSLEQNPNKVLSSGDRFELPNGHILGRGPLEDTWTEKNKDEWIGGGIGLGGDYIQVASSDSRYVTVAMKQSSKVKIYDLKRKRYLNDTPDGNYAIFGPGCVIYKRLNHLAFYWLDTETVTFKIMGGVESRLYDMSWNGASLVFLWMQDDHVHKIVMIDLTDIKNITLTTINETKEVPLRMAGFLFPTPSTVVFSFEWRIYVFDTISMTFIVNRKEADDSSELFAISPDGRVIFHRRPSSSVIANDLLIMPINATDELIEFLDDVTDSNVGALVGDKVDFRPEQPLIIINDVELISMANQIKRMSKDGKRLIFRDGYNGMASTIVFKHPFPHPVFEQVKPDRTWIRILSNFTLDTHLTWPGPGLSLIRETIDTIRSLGFKIDSIQAAVGVVYAGSGLTFERATELYLTELVRVIAKEIILK